MLGRPWTVYIHQPPGLHHTQLPGHVCLLKNSLHGLIQAPHNGILSNYFDHSLFIYQHGNDIVYILLYVDAIILAASSDSLYELIMSKLNFEFFVKSSPVQLFFFLKINMQRKLLSTHVCLLASHHPHMWIQRQNSVVLQETPMKIQHNIITSLDLCNTWHLQDQISLLKFKKCACLYITQKHNTCLFEKYYYSWHYWV